VAVLLENAIGLLPSAFSKSSLVFWATWPSKATLSRISYTYFKWVKASR